MAYLHLTFCVILIYVLTPSISSPIMVQFGTKGGPIVPPPSTTTTTPAPNSYSKPAPVFEEQEDIPNPTVYRPLVPHQYRNKIYKNKPNPNLILGTPLDQRYTPSIQKYYQKPQKSFGLEYRGPQSFGHQTYEEKYQRLDYNEPKYQQKGQVHVNNYDTASRKQEQIATKSVPQIGVVYSAGVRYYVPQIVYDYDDIDNSVYEANDLKYYYHNRVKNY